MEYPRSILVSFQALHELQAIYVCKEPLFDGCDVYCAVFYGIADRKNPDDVSQVDIHLCSTVLEVVTR